MLIVLINHEYVKSISLNNDGVIFHTTFRVFQQGMLKIVHVFSGKTGEKIWTVAI